MAVRRNRVSMKDERERRVERGGLEAGGATPHPRPRQVFCKRLTIQEEMEGSRFEVSNEDNRRESPPTLTNHLV